MDFILAQTEVAWIGPIIQLVQLGGFGALVWFFVWIRMPAIEKASSDERERWLEYMRQRDEKFETLIERTIKCIEETNARRTH